MPFKVWSEGNSPGKPSSTPSVGLNLFFFSLSWALSLCCLQHSQWSLFHNYLHVCPSPLLYCSFFKGGDYVLTIYFSVPCYPKCTTWNKQKPRMSVWEKNEEMNIVYIPPWHHKAGPIPPSFGTQRTVNTPPTSPQSCGCRRFWNCLVRLWPQSKLMETINLFPPHFEVVELK